LAKSILGIHEGKIVCSVYKVRCISGVEDILSGGARIVNLSSHLGHLSMINGDEKSVPNPLFLYETAKLKINAKL
jgi:hypothetical protein